jgi:hypothetical protein
MSCSWEFAYTMKDGVNMNDFIDTFVNSFEPFALSHAINPILLFLLFLMVTGQYFSWIIDYVKMSKVILQSTKQISLKSLPRYLKYLIYYFLILFGVFFLFFWENFENLIAAFSVTLKIRVPSITNSTNIFATIINEVWFGDTYTNSVLDLVDGLFALFLAVYILKKYKCFFWKPTSNYVFIFKILLILFNFFVQCVCMLYIKLNSCIPTNSTLLSGNFNINTIQIGNLIFMSITIVTFIVLWWLHTRNFNDYGFESEICRHFGKVTVYFCVYTFLVCISTVVIIQSIYIQMWVARLCFCLLLWFNERYKFFKL